MPHVILETNELPRREEIRPCLKCGEGSRDYVVSSTFGHDVDGPVVRRLPICSICQFRIAAWVEAGVDLFQNPDPIKAYHEACEILSAAEAARR